MKDWTIRVEGLGKRYNLDHRAGNRDDTLLSAFASGLGSMLRAGKKKSTEEFWALRDVNFTVAKGDRVGIIGRNGAGKSTLLKILSRVVAPSVGRIEYLGKMASLLEVGTGFHGELTGRENIYLNGTILGMGRREIDRKFDEIVAFSEIEKFLDTPVKRYSSGMYVRLAFAVAAHLDNDILVVDEVLAVGDAAFQEKCIGKISEASGGGKTVLFVSHNIGQISAVCNRGILLEKGQVAYDGDVQFCIDRYMRRADREVTGEVLFDLGGESMSIRELRIRDKRGNTTPDLKHDEGYGIECVVECTSPVNDVLLGILVNDMSGKRIMSMQTPVSAAMEIGKTRTFKASLPGNLLTPGEYMVTAALHIPNMQVLDEKEGALRFRIFDNGSEFYKYSGDVGYIFPQNEWTVS